MHRRIKPPLCVGWSCRHRPPQAEAEIVKLDIECLSSRSHIEEVVAYDLW